jgi:hypothetical protein
MAGSAPDALVVCVDVDDRETTAVAAGVTAAGVSAEEAAGWVTRMHGPFRIPTMLKRLDQLARGRKTHEQ